MAEIYDGDWREGTIIGKRTRANGLTFYEVSFRSNSRVPWLTTKRMRAMNHA